MYFLRQAQAALIEVTYINFFPSLLDRFPLHTPEETEKDCEWTEDCLGN
jgi:hypothetical protein